MAKILIVEDDPAISNTIRSWLEKEKYVVESTASGREGLDLLKHYNFDLAILDWQLPDLNGPEISKSLQAENKRIPLLMLTSMSSTDNKIYGLDAGAYDYIVKPCSMEELSARIRALLRRTIDETARENSIELGNLKIFLGSHEVFVESKALKLSPSEYEILKLLIGSPGASFSSEAVFARLWQDKPNVSKQLVKVHVMNLRKKLAAVSSSVELLTNDLNEYYLKAKQE